MVLFLLIFGLFCLLFVLGQLTPAPFLKYVVLPEPRVAVDDAEMLKKSGLPRLFIINTQIPDKPPVMMGKVCVHA